MTILYAILQQNKPRTESRKQVKIQANGEANGNRNRKTCNKFTKKNPKSFYVFWSQDNTVYQVVSKWSYRYITAVDSYMSH